MVNHVPRVIVKRKKIKYLRYIQIVKTRLKCYNMLRMDDPKRLYQYLNPMMHLGETTYSIRLPLLATIVTVILLEIYVHIILQNPDAVGLYAIILFVALIVYFAFREGIRGGLIATCITLSYYFYIIYSRNYEGEELLAGIITTLALGIIYGFLALIIGWLKQRIDSLIENEADEKERLKAIIQQLPVGIVITDNKGKVVEGNKKLEKILGHGVKIGRIAGKDTISEFRINNKLLPPSQTPLAKALATGKTIVRRNIVHEQNDGKKSYLQVQASIIRNKKGRVIAAASIINDVSRQKEEEKRKDDFVNMASHELKTPITSMKLYIDTLAHLLKDKNQKAMKITQSLKFQTDRLQALVSDLLDVSRIQTGKLIFNKEIFQIDKLIEDIVDAMQGMSKHEIVYQKGKFPFTVNADRFRIYQVLANLINNALKYSPQDQKIHISAKKTNGRVIVRVEDHGIGISKENQKRIFDRLYQVTDKKAKTFPGLGLGLYISKEIIKRHNGRMWVESEKDKGSTFYFTLPRVYQNDSSSKNRRT